jgi:hypothetical protein
MCYGGELVAGDTLQRHYTKQGSPQCLSTASGRCLANRNGPEYALRAAILLGSANLQASMARDGVHGSANQPISTRESLEQRLPEGTFTFQWSDRVYKYRGRLAFTSGGYKVKVYVGRPVQILWLHGPRHRICRYYLQGYTLLSSRCQRPICRAQLSASSRP